MGELTIEGLQQEVAALNSSKQELTDANKQLGLDNKELKDQVDTLLKDKESLVNENQALKEVIKNLQATVKEQEKFAPVVYTAKYEKSTYVVKGGTRIPGGLLTDDDRRILTAEEISKEPAVVEWLIENKSPILELKK